MLSMWGFPWARSGDFSGSRIRQPDWLLVRTIRFYFAFTRYPLHPRSGSRFSHSHIKPSTVWAHVTCWSIFPRCHLPYPLNHPRRGSYRSPSRGRPVSLLQEVGPSSWWLQPYGTSFWRNYTWPPSCGYSGDDWWCHHLMPPFFWSSFVLYIIDWCYLFYSYFYCYLLICPHCL